MERRSFITAMAAVPVVPALAQRRFGGGPNRLEFLAGYLGLTDSQKAQAKTILDAADSAAETVRGEMMSARQATRDEIKAGKSDAELEQVAATVGSHRRAPGGHPVEGIRKDYAMLTTEQNANDE